MPTVLPRITTAMPAAPSGYRSSFLRLSTTSGRLRSASDMFCFGETVPVEPCFAAM
jgi:hypothetical protein